MSFLPRWFIGVAIAVLLLLVAGFGSVAFVYGVTRHQWDTPFVRKVAALTYFPAARVASVKVPYTDYLTLLDAQNVLLSTDAAKQQGLQAVPEVDRRKGAYETLLKNAATEDLAAKENIVVTPLDVDRFYDQLVGLNSTSTTTTVQDVDKYLQTNFHWTSKEYKQYVVRSGMLRDILSQKHQQAGSATTTEDLITQRLAQPDVKRYLRF